MYNAFTFVLIRQLMCSSHLVNQMQLSSSCHQSELEDGHHSGNKSNHRSTSSGHRSDRMLFLMCCVVQRFLNGIPVCVKDDQQQCDSVSNRENRIHVVSYMTFYMHLYMDLQIIELHT